MPFSSNINPDDVYKNIINDAVSNGNLKGDRTGTGTVSVVGRSARYSLLNGRSPRLTTKLLTDTPEREMLWFRSGISWIRELRDQGIGIWNGWMLEGTAKYRPKTTEELVKQAIKFFAPTGHVHLYIRSEFDKISSHSGVNAYGKFLVKLTYDGNETKVNIYGSADDFDNFDEMVKELANVLNIDPNYLVDGDIGPGGYGPQWRHWQDTQIILDNQRSAYLAKGYKVVGRTNSSFRADYHEWDLKDKIKERIYANHPDVSEVQFNSDYEDIDESRDNVFKWSMVQGVGTMDVYHTGERALQEIYKSLYHIPTLIVHREVDQLANAVELLRNDPNSRRIIVSAWNPGLTWQAALPPCHCFFQFISHELTLEQRYAIARDRMELQKYDLNKEADKGFMDMALRTWMRYDLETDRKDYTDEELHGNMDAVGIKRRGLYCFLLLRSNDLGLGQPFNVAQYASLTHMIAQCVKMEPLELIWNAVDAHVYANHVAALQEQLEREPKHCIPRIKLNSKRKEIDDFTIGDITIIDYESHPSMATKMPPAI